MNSWTPILPTVIISSRVRFELGGDLREGPVHVDGKQFGQIGGRAERVAGKGDSVGGHVRGGFDDADAGDGDPALAAYIAGVEGGNDSHADHGVPGGWVHALEIGGAG